MWWGGGVMVGGKVLEGRGNRSSVIEPLAGFLPATRGAPHVLVLHAVHLAALLGLPAAFPAGGERLGRRRERGVQTAGGSARGAGGPVLRAAERADAHREPRRVARSRGTFQLQPQRSKCGTGAWRRHGVKEWPASLVRVVRVHWVPEAGGRRAAELRGRVWLPLAGHAVRAAHPRRVH